MYQASLKCKFGLCPYSARLAALAWRALFAQIAQRGTPSRRRLPTVASLLLPKNSKNPLKH
jgi:hypothetical protein